MHTSLKTSVWFIGGLATLSCQPLTESGPEPFRPQFYSLVIVDDKPLPQQYFPEGNYSLVGGKLAPYAVGRTIDQRLVNDRGGRGSTGGNTRDTTVLRGQFLDIRTLELTVGSDVIRLSDSLIVDAAIVDTTIILTRPHPDPSRTVVDTGYFVNGYLVLATSIDTDRYQVYRRPLPRRVFMYEIGR